MESVMETAIANPLDEVQKMLTEHYGPLMRHDQVAEVLDVSPESLGNTMRRSHEPNVVYLKRNKLRFGRRVRYSAITVAEALVLDHAELARRLEGFVEGGAANVG
tara:strand:- start:6410 stop:6724 length:315 start_codon:yes stop_codon:yes gene_type:complete